MKERPLLGAIRHGQNIDPERDAPTAAVCAFEKLGHDLCPIRSCQTGCRPFTVHHWCEAPVLKRPLNYHHGFHLLLALSMLDVVDL